MTSSWEELRFEVRKITAMVLKISVCTFAVHISVWGVDNASMIEHKLLGTWHTSQLQWHLNLNLIEAVHQPSLMQSLFAAPQRHPWLAPFLMQCWSPSLKDATSCPHPVVLVTTLRKSCCLLPADFPTQWLLVVEETPPGRFLLHTLHWAQRGTGACHMYSIDISEILCTKWAW